MDGCQSEAPQCRGIPVKPPKSSQLLKSHKQRATPIIFTCSQKTAEVNTVTIVWLSAGWRHSSFFNCIKSYTLAFEKKRQQLVYCGKETIAHFKLQENMKKGLLQTDSHFLSEHLWAAAHSCEGGGGCNHTYADFLTPQAWIFLPYWQQWKCSLPLCSSVFNVYIIWTELWFWNTGKARL